MKRKVFSEEQIIGVLKEDRPRLVSQQLPVIHGGGISS
jgi:hypothetical protein